MWPDNCLKQRKVDQVYHMIAISALNGPDRAENHERFNVFSATGGADLKPNCYNR